MTKAVIFDCFGVLVGTGYWNVYESLGGNLEKDKEFLDEVLGRANSGLISSNELHELTSSRLGISKDKWVEAIHADEQPNKQLFSFIKTKLFNKVKLTILSNAGAGVLERKIPPHLLSLFDTVVVSGEAGFLKPDPAIFSYTLRKLGVQPEEAVFIDDHAEYFTGTKQLGIHSILFTSVNKLLPEIRSLI